LVEHCRHARFVWNLAVEQQRHWQAGRQAPGYNEQCAQLTAARAEYGWLAAGSQSVQQQALRDFAQVQTFLTAPTVARRGARQASTKGSGKSGSSRATSNGSAAAMDRYGYPKSAG
jgi:putative transposase